MTARPLFPRAGKLSFDGSFSPASALSVFVPAAYLATLAAPTLTNEAKHVAAGVRHFARYLKRAPRLEDLTSATLTALCFWLMEHGRARPTVDRYREMFLRIARRAVDCEILSAMPRVAKLRSRWHKSKWTPYPRAELNRIFGAARTMPGTVSKGFAAWDWWPALLFTILDLQISAPPLLMLPASAADLNAGTIKCGLFIHRLRPQTVTALRALGVEPRERLFPWELDGRHPPFCQLYYHFRELLWRAAVPSKSRGMFERLRQTAVDDPEALAKIDFNTRFILRERPPRQTPAPARMGDRRRARSSEAAPCGFLADNAKTRSLRHKNRAPQLHLIGPIPGQENKTLSAFFETVYAPRRFANSPRDTVVCYRTAVRRLNEFCCCVVLLDRLSDNLIEGFLAWLAACRYSAATRKRMRGELLSIWRFAWRKGFVETLPRDVDDVKVPKTIPDAWSVAEVGRLLAVAAATQGQVSGFPAGLYWSALLMLIYDTGLRVGAVMQLRTVDVDLETGWVKARFETQKQKADQVLPLHRDTVALLLQMGEHGRELLFPFPFRSRESLTARLRILLQRAGLPSGKRDLFHKLRRTNGTYVADVAGEEAAMRQLGHSGIQVTRRYIDPRKLSLPRIADLMQRPHWKAPILLGHDSVSVPVSEPFSKKEES